MVTSNIIKQKTPEIIALRELCSNPEARKDINIKIPPYQRPYTWSKKSVTTLYNDILEAFQKHQQEYRLGSIILFREINEFNYEEYHIVDGQQRLTTLGILLYCLNQETSFQILKSHYSYLSNDKILENYELLARRVKELDKIKIDFENYILDNCKVVLVITNKQQEAFQFFDSQNNRGKELEPHDLLKSYHLREMRNVDRENKKELINTWEAIDQKQLAKFFKDNLFPIIRWYRKEDGLGYSIKNIDEFKGISIGSPYNYVHYHLSSHLFNETKNFLLDKYLRSLKTKEINQFQLTEPILAGERFFRFVLHYKNLLKKVEDKIAKYHGLKNKSKEKEIPTDRMGDRYIKDLYENVLLFFADRFGINSLTDEIMGFLYSVIYILRLRMYSIYKETINNYAKGIETTISSGSSIGIKISPIFDYIGRMRRPDEIHMLEFEIYTIDGKILTFQELTLDSLNNKNKNKNYDAIFKKIINQTNKEEYVKP